jgi:hypothetical protein
MIEPLKEATIRTWVLSVLWATQAPWKAGE